MSQSLFRRSTEGFYDSKKTWKTSNRDQATDPKLEKVKEVFTRYDHGEISKSDLRDALTNDLGINPTPELRRKLNEADITYKDLVKNLASPSDRSKEAFPSQIRPNTMYFPRYRKEIHFAREEPTNMAETLHNPPKTVYVAEDSNNLQAKISDFVNGSVSSPEFVQTLRENGVNVDRVRPLLREYNHNAQISHHDLAAKILKESTDRPFTDDPSYLPKDILESGKDFKPFVVPSSDYDQNRLDKLRKEEQARHLSHTYVPKKKQPPPGTVGNKAHGDIISWGGSYETHSLQTSPRKANGIRSVPEIAEKYKGNLDNQFNDLSRPTTNEAPRVKNLKYHTSSANIISWT